MGKKNKRTDDDAGAATTLKHKSKKVKVDMLPHNASEVDAVAVYFPAGQPADGADYTLYENTTSGKPTYTLIGEKGKINYVGRTHGEEYAGTGQTCSQVMGIYDKQTHKLQLLPVVCGRIMRMEPRLPGLQYDATATSLAVGADEEATTRAEALADNKKLVDNFGSTRRRRQLTAREEGTVRVEKLGDAAGALSALLGSINKDAAAAGLTKQQVLAQANSHRYLPPHFEDANTPQTAYPIDKLIPAEVSHALKIGRYLKAAEDGGEIQALREHGLANDYVISRIPLLNDSDKSAAKTRARLLAYLNLLMKLKTGRPTLSAHTDEGGIGEGMKKLAKGLRTTPETLEPLLQLFYNASQEDNSIRYSRSKTQENLLMAYICVTTLLVEPHACVAAEHMNTLSNCLKMSTQDVVTRYREVGAVCKAAVVKLEGGEGTAKSYSATLLPDPSKTLKECLPGIKMLTKARK